MVTPMRSRHRVAGKRMEPENRRGIPEFSPNRGDADQTEGLEGHEGSGSGHWATCKPAILTIEISHGGQE